MAEYLLVCQYFNNQQPEHLLRSGKIERLANISKNLNIRVHLLDLGVIFIVHGGNMNESWYEIR